MSKITLPHGVKDEFYYKEVFAPIFHIMYCNIKSNVQNTVRDVAIGEYMPLFNLVITINLTIYVLFGIRRIEEWICKVGYNKKLLLDNKNPCWKLTDTELKDLDDQEDDCCYLWG